MGRIRTAHRTSGLISALEKVFLAYWNARLSRNWEEARKMEAPYFQEMTTPSRYKVYLTAGRKNQVKELQLLQFNWEEEQLCSDKHGIANSTERREDQESPFIRLLGEGGK